MRRGITLIAKDTFTNVLEASLDNVFSNTYKQYKIVINATADTSPSDSQLRLRLRSGGTDNSAQNYPFQELFAGSTSISANRVTTNTAVQAVNRNDNFTQLSIFEMLNPYQSTYTSGHSLYVRSANGNISLSKAAFSTTVTTSYDGFTVFNVDGLTISGSLTVYGMEL